MIPPSSILTPTHSRSNSRINLRNRSILYWIAGKSAIATNTSCDGRILTSLMTRGFRYPTSLQPITNLLSVSIADTHVRLGLILLSLINHFLPLQFPTPLLLHRLPLLSRRHPRRPSPAPHLSTPRPSPAPLPLRPSLPLHPLLVPLLPPYLPLPRVLLLHRAYVRIYGLTTVTCRRRRPRPALVACRVPLKDSLRHP